MFRRPATISYNRKMARSERFELPTLGIEIRCSIQLSYERLGPDDGPPSHGIRPCWAASSGERSDAFELAERRDNKKPYSPPPGAERSAHQVVSNRPKCGCCATSIIGLPGCGAGCILATLRRGWACGA